MTTIKHTLQRQVFLPKDERLVAVVHVTKAGKKKKASFMCAAVTTEKPIQAIIYQVKRSEKIENLFKIKCCWALRELKTLDGKDSTRDTAEFELHFDKVYKWIASSVTERNAFIQCLWKLSQRYVVQKPEIVNVPPGVLEDSSQTSEADKSVQQAEEIAMTLDSDYQALSSKEETDIEVLIADSDDAISNAEAFAAQLARDLSVLDGANIHSIMGSEDQVLDLMLLLDQALQETLKVEEKLEEYDCKLQGVKELMDSMKDKDSLIQIKSTNHEKLLDTLDSMVSQLDLEYPHQQVLLESDLSSAKDVSACVTAAELLQRCLSADIPPELTKMAAVQDQKKRFLKLKTMFAKRLSHHLNNLFIHQGNKLEGTMNRAIAGDLRLPNHRQSQHELQTYTELMSWLKVADTKSFDELKKVYTDNLSRLYEREAREFMEAAKQKILPHKPEKRGTLPTGQRQGSSTSLNKLAVAAGGADHRRHSEMDVAGNRRKFDQVFEQVLSELGPWCLAEQDFCMKFFHLSGDVSLLEVARAQAQKDALTPTKTLSKTPSKTSMKTPTKSPAGTPDRRDTATQRQINEEVRKMMGDLFATLESELNKFITFGDQLDTFNSLYMLVRMSEHVINAEDTGSFLSMTFASCLVQIKRSFDTFVKGQIHAMEEYKVTKKMKVGILPFVHSFENFAGQAEQIYRHTDRRTDLDKAYSKLIVALFDQINRVAAESIKTPATLVMCENYHHLFSSLAQLKIAHLDTHKKEAKLKYQENLNRYVTSCLGRPMENLNVFFEGVQRVVQAGVKEEEVSFQLAFSKQELRKVIKHYPGKEVKKNLELLYKQVSKQHSEEENLLQVIWHTMQDEFLKQYSHFEQLIHRCYPDSGITLEFTINDLLGYFSDIARSH